MTAVRRATPFLASALLLTLAGCSVLTGSPPSPAGGGQVRPAGPVGLDDIAAMRAAWEAQGVDDYAWSVAFGCECLLNGPTDVRVVDGVAVEAVNNAQPVDLANIEGFPLTIDAMFDAAQATLDGGGTAVATWGAGSLPTQLNLDRDLQAVDDELGITILGLTPAP